MLLKRCFVMWQNDQTLLDKRIYKFQMCGKNAWQCLIHVLDSVSKCLTMFDRLVRTLAICLIKTTQNGNLKFSFRMRHQRNTSSIDENERDDIFDNKTIYTYSIRNFRLTSSMTRSEVGNIIDTTNRWILDSITWASRVTGRRQIANFSTKRKKKYGWKSATISKKHCWWHSFQV